MNHGTKFCRLCLKLSPPTTLTSSLPFYHQDERALPGYPLTRCSFFPFRYKAPLAFPQMFYLYFYSYTTLPDSFSLSSASNGYWLACDGVEPQGCHQSESRTWAVSVSTRHACHNQQSPRTRSILYVILDIMIDHRQVQWLPRGTSYYTKRDLLAANFVWNISFNTGSI
jgi:hypothetical protein